jgi:hypothetical protein
MLHLKAICILLTFGISSTLAYSEQVQSKKNGFYEFEFQKTTGSGGSELFHTDTKFHDLERGEDISIEKSEIKCDIDERTSNVNCNLPHLQFNKNGNSPVATFQIKGDPMRSGISSKNAFCRTHALDVNRYTCKEIVSGELGIKPSRSIVISFFTNAVTGSSCKFGPEGEAVVPVSKRDTPIKISSDSWTESDCIRFLKTMGQNNLLKIFAELSSDGEKILYIERTGYEHTGFISSAIISSIWKDRSVDLNGYMFPECGAYQPAFFCAVSFYGSIPGSNRFDSVFRPRTFKLPFLDNGLKYEDSVKVTSEGVSLDLFLKRTRSPKSHTCLLHFERHQRCSGIRQSFYWAKRTLHGEFRFGKSTRNSCPGVHGYQSNWKLSGRWFRRKCAYLSDFLPSRRN